MRPALNTSVGLLVLLLSACDLKVKQAKTPPPPQPVAHVEPPPAPPSNEPLSIAQTQVRLPDPQPIDPDAVAAPPTPPEPGSPRPKPRRQRPAPQPAAPSSAKPDTAETTEAAPATDMRPRRMEPVLPTDLRRQRVEEISNRLHDVDEILTRVQAAHALADQQKHAVERIRNFASRAYQAKDQGDIQTASGLADRALKLAQELERDAH